MLRFGGAIPGETMAHPLAAGCLNPLEVVVPKYRRTDAGLQIVSSP